MSAILSITDSQIFTALTSYLQNILPSSCQIIRGQQNRVPELVSQDFLTITPIKRPRLATNFDGQGDVKFTGSIALTILDVTAVAFGEIVPGATVFGEGVTTNTTIVVQLTGTPGDIGTYTVSASQSVSSETLSSGLTNSVQSTDVIVQLDIHGPNSANNFSIISTTWRDDYAIQFFLNLDPPVPISPLYEEERGQMPFLNGESQVEDRWVLDLHMEVNLAVSTPQQYADRIAPGLINVNATFAP